MAGLHEVVARERSAIAAHRSSLRGASLPPAGDAPKGTFLHGFLLPFSLILATLRDGELRRPYVLVAAVRLLIVAAIAALGCATGSPKAKKEHSGPQVVLHHEMASRGAPASSGVHVHLPGVHVDLDARRGEPSEVKVLGQTIPVVEDDEPSGAMAATHAPPEGARGLLASGWAWIAAFFAMVSGLSGIVVALSRRYDDWLGFGASRLALVAPEDATRKVPKIGLDLKWLKKKVKERVRESVAFAAGMPVLALLLFVPHIGALVFSVASVAWGWYWLGVFTAAKTDHALADEETAPSPRMIRGLASVASTRWWTAPLRAYGRLWARLTRGWNSPAAFFERAPAPFLGLALARAILSLPGLYFLAKPIVPVAASRLCAEADPHGRFIAVAGGGDDDPSR